MERDHRYHVRLDWTGDVGGARDYRLAAEGKKPIEGSADPSFRGDASRWNPEEMLVASLSACHQLWYLGLCAAAGIAVTAYRDEATGTMHEEAGGAGQFVEVALHPHVTLASGSDAEAARRLHERAHQMCFIARSINFPVHCRPVVVVDAP